MHDEVVKHHGKIIQVVERPALNDQGEHLFTMEIARRAPGVRLILVDWKAGSLSMSREFRYEADAFELRLPGGKVFDRLDSYLATLGEHGQVPIGDILTAASKEAEEEMGISLDPADFEIWGRDLCGATVEWDLYVLYADVSTANRGEQDLEVGENISVVDISFADLISAMLSLDMKMESRTYMHILRFLVRHRESVQPGPVRQWLEAGVALGGEGE